MKKLIFNFTITLVVLFIFSNVALAQFEGSIEFKKETPKDTITYIYYVKGNMVRIDEIGSKSHKIEGTFLVDMDAKTMKSLNHDRKLYLDQPTPEAPVIKGICTVKKEENTKNLQGYKCIEYVVTNTDENTQVTYYVADDRFTFFEKLLHQMNRKDRSSVYYLQIPELKNFFPMLAIQTDLSGKEVLRLEVTKVTQKKMDAAMFEMPKEYNKFEK